MFGSNVSFKQISSSADGFYSHLHAQVQVRTCLKLNVGQLHRFHNQLSCVFEVFVLLNHLTAQVSDGYAETSVIDLLPHEPMLVISCRLLLRLKVLILEQGLFL